VAFYPPGIPVVAPGEIVSPELIAYCQEMLLA
jgi:arginine/lysine/ornithine decarboxylase